MSGNVGIHYVIFSLNCLKQCLYSLMSFRLSFRSLILGCSAKCLKMCHFHFFELSETVSLFSDKLFEFEFEFSSDTGLEFLYKNV